MSDTDHAAAIRRATDRVTADISKLVWESETSKPLGDIVDAAIDKLVAVDEHADALQRERDEAREALAAERARVERLQRYGELWEDDFREQMQGQHFEFVETTILEMRREVLQPGDLPASDEGEVTT